MSRGRQREFRAAPGNVPQLRGIPFPSLVVAYRQRPREELDHKLMILEATRWEMLGAITAEGLAAAGYSGASARALFRREWMIHNKRRFEPLMRVMVFTVRPYAEDSLPQLGEALVRHLYGEFLDEQSTNPQRTGVAAGGTRNASADTAPHTTGDRISAQD